MPGTPVIGDRPQRQVNPMRYFLVFSALSSSACLATDSESDPGIVTGETLAVYGQAGLGCDQCPDPEPTMSYQTPSGLRIGVAEVELLTSADDANPHSLLLAAPAHDADLVAGATFCAVDVGSIPEGVYTHMRVKLDWIRYTVDATGHSAGFALPGSLDVDYVLSDYDDAELGARAQGDYLATFVGAGMQVPQAGIQPVEFPTSHPDGTVDTSGGAYRVTFPTPDHPIIIAHGRPESVDVNITYFIDDAFGWLDRAEPGFVADVFDLADNPIATEQPASMAIQGFAMEVCDAELCSTP